MSSTALPKCMFPTTLKKLHTMINETQIHANISLHQSSLCLVSYQDSGGWMVVGGLTVSIHSQM